MSTFKMMKYVCAFIHILFVTAFSEWPVPYPEELKMFENMRNFTASQTQYASVCASPEKFAGDSYVTFEEFNSEKYHEPIYFTGPCSEVFRTNRCFIGWDWGKVTCSSFKTDEHKYIISQIGRCCSDGKSICDV